MIVVRNIPFASFYTGMRHFVQLMSCDTSMHKDRSWSWMVSFQAQFDADTARDPFKRLAGVPQRRWSQNTLGGAISNLGRRSTAIRPAFST